MSGVNTNEMKEYLAVDGDDDLIDNLIKTAEYTTASSIGGSRKLDEYRKNSAFNQAVRILVDFYYFNRGMTDNSPVAYPRSYQMLLNTFRFKDGDISESSDS